MIDCVFCKIVRNEVPAFKIFEDGKYLAFLDINPVNPGHLLVILKEHVDNVFDLDEADYSDVFLVCKKLTHPLQQVTKAKRIGLAVEGFGVPHLHIHLIPLNHPNELDPHRAVKGATEDLEKMKKEILRVLKVYKI